MTAVQLAKAEVVISGQTIPVQFNPTSLQVEITNSVNQQGEAGGTNQVSTQSSAKMGLDLLFDTSASGEDVRVKTRPLRAAVRAPQDGGSGGGAAGGSSSNAGAAFTPPLVTFQWGTFTFAGIAESYRETLDFFSADGVPLRAQVAMSLKEQPGEFTALERPNPRGAASPSAFEVPAALGGGGAAGVAALGGDLRAARAIAGANGEASLRFSAGASLAVDAGVELREAVSFSGGGLSLGAGVGAGAGIGAGAGFGGGAGIGAAVGAGIGGAAGSGAALTAGTASGAAAAAASAGGAAAAAALPASTPALRFDARRLAPRAPARQLATDAGASFALDGRALPGGAAGLRSDVGNGRPLSSRLRFER